MTYSEVDTFVEGVLGQLEDFKVIGPVEFDVEVDGSRLRFEVMPNSK